MVPRYCAIPRHRSLEALWAQRPLVLPFCYKLPWSEETTFLGGAASVVRPSPGRTVLVLATGVSLKCGVWKLDHTHEIKRLRQNWRNK